ncbi:MAG: PCYCGC motif-containing lipoprotein [Acidobacteria bacterium]|nr:PCYCGC motif-containing lipoprotein [Acidobacteriota bacterium]
MPDSLDGLPMPPLPYVPEMVPRPVELVKRAYVFAAQNPGVLGYVPCYCGCENNGHVSNVNCFVASRAPNGAVESWDTHGMT